MKSTRITASTGARYLAQQHHNNTSSTRQSYHKNASRPQYLHLTKQNQLRSSTNSSTLSRNRSGLLLSSRYNSTTSSASASSTNSNKKGAGLRLSLIGPPGGGKGTQSKKLVAEFGLPTISTGDVLRDHVQRNTAIGTRAADQMKAGGYVDDEIMKELIESTLFVPPLLHSGWVLDGYPRTASQGKQLQSLLAKYSQPQSDGKKNGNLDAVLYLDVPHTVLLERLCSRWIHPKSGRIYNTQYNPPKVKGIDDVTGEPLVQRADDTPEVISQRLQHFVETVSPILSFYQKLGILHTIPSPSSDVGWVTIQKLVSQLIAAKSSSKS